MIKNKQTKINFLADIETWHNTTHTNGSMKHNEREKEIGCK